MICNKCNHKLPDDSKFCQYCGNKIETVVEPIASIEDLELNIDYIKPEESAYSRLNFQAQNTVKAMEANSKTQPNNEEDDDFGLVPEKPIYTLAWKSVDGEREYLSKLRTPKGEKVKWNRRGSISVKGINGIIDIYDIYLMSGQKYTTIYINMYGANASKRVPAGFGAKKTQGIKKPEERQRVKKADKPKNLTLDVINIFVLLLTTIVSGVGLDASYYYNEGIFAAILIIGIVTIILKIIATAKLKNSIVLTSIISCALFIMTVCSVVTEDVEFGPWICIFTLYLLICELCKIIRAGIEKYHSTQSYKFKCYKKINLINEYRVKGVITQEEFEKTRKQIISRIK